MWSRRDSNPRPVKVPISFLHAYCLFGSRKHQETNTDELLPIFLDLSQGSWKLSALISSKGCGCYAVYEDSSAARLQLVLYKDPNLKQPLHKKCCHLNCSVPGLTSVSTAYSACLPTNYDLPSIPVGPIFSKEWKVENSTCHVEIQKRMDIVIFQRA